MQWLEDLLSDLRFAGTFVRNPGFALSAIFCLALGIGANTTIFSIVSSFLFSQPSCRDSASMISIWEGGNSGSSVADYRFLRDARIFDGMAGINVEREVNWRQGDRTSRFYAGIVTDDFFTTLDFPFLLVAAYRSAKQPPPCSRNGSGEGRLAVIRRFLVANWFWTVASTPSLACFRRTTVRSLVSAFSRLLRSGRAYDEQVQFSRACPRA